MEFCTKLIGIDYNEFETCWLNWGEKNMREIFRHADEYSGTMVLSSAEGNNEALWMSVTDCDGENTITVRIPRDSLGNLVLSAGDWFDEASRRKR